jgi:CubicO group peptidase (beta-lactamase class C family)
LGWDENELEDLYSFLEQNETRAFIILVDGKIVTEKYWNKDILGNNDFTKDSNWYWASAGKSLTAAMTGIAQDEGLLAINEPTSTYLGDGWTSLTAAQENRITIKNQLSMSSGLDYTSGQLGCTAPSCLTYKTDPNQQWYYHNAPYTLLHQVMENAANDNFNNLTAKWIGNPIGMSGFWRESGENKVYWSTARDAARFGLLNLARGSWNDQPLISEVYFNEMTNSSQNLNPSYGYLWWLNGKEETIFPTMVQSTNRPVTLNAPDDMFSALGKNGQIIDVVPSLGMVVVRMGEAPDNGDVPIQFHDQLWQLLRAVMD